MINLHDVKNKCNYKDFSTPRNCCTDILIIWQKRFIIIKIMLCIDNNVLILIFLASCKTSIRSFSKHYSKWKMVSIKFRKTLKRWDCQKKIISQDNSQNNFLNFLTSEKHFHNLVISCNIPGISLEYFRNRNLWNVPWIFWKYYLVITEIYQKINICHYKIIHF